MSARGYLCPACLELAGPVIESAVQVIREDKRILRQEIATLKEDFNSLALSSFGTTQFGLCYTKAVSAANRTFAAEIGRLLLQKPDGGQDSKNSTNVLNSLLELVEII